MNAILYANGTSENHGCEAIAITTIDMLDEFVEKIYCSTTNLKYEKKEKSLMTENPKSCLVEYYYYRKKTIVNLVISKLERIFFHKNNFYTSKAWTTQVEKAFSKCKVAFSVGGDNYCNQDVEWLYKLHDAAKEKGLITILWGCSVEETCLTDSHMKEDLSKFDLICARESLSYEILSKINSNVKLFPDPAFLLEPDYVALPDGFGEKNTIGINVSPTIIGFEKENGIVHENYIELIKYIIGHTDFQIALIPHVIFGKKYCDYEVLKKLYDKFEDTKRVVLIEDCNCRQLKGYIARCKLFVTARTHASIAAYSTCVPTLVVGYSIKARGIAKDIFGTYENYVIPVQEMKTKEDLKERFIWLERNQKNIKEKLIQKMPSYKKMAKEAQNEIGSLLKNLDL